MRNPLNTTPSMLEEHIHTMFKPEFFVVDAESEATARMHRVQRMMQDT